MDPTTVLLATLTCLLLPWMAWVSKILISIQIRLARGEENFDRVRNSIEDHETRIRALEAFH
jgi:hypothetical protein|tara:strand:+ start:44 stop:229 length:186 start_codon:yes stop_codon:yes gene_type:complete